MIRNIYAYEDENPSWKAALDAFPNRVPRFQTKSEAIAFTKQHCTTTSNPDHPQLQHSVTTLISWEQIERYMLPKMIEYDSKWKRISHHDVDMSTNRFRPSSLVGGSRSEEKDIKRFLLNDYLLSRLSLPIHSTLSADSRMNTLRYTFNHMKCGIFLMIRNNQVVMFVPFVNKDYRNTWSDVLKVDSADGKVSTYTKDKASYYGYEEENLLEKSQWWANGNIICNTYGGKEGDENGPSAVQYWGDHFLLAIKDMFAELCRCRTVPDCDLFINKRDYPQLKFNSAPAFPGGPQPVEPYGFIFDKDDRKPEEDVPLVREKFQSYAPILSFYSSSRFADIPIPPTEDWEAATGEVFPGSFVHSNENGELKVSDPRDLFTQSNLQKFDRPWEEKVPIAFFRGTATGGGTTPETNQRMHLAQVSHNWTHHPKYGGKNPGINQGHPYLDAKITGWNKRDKKIAASPVMTFVRDRDFPFSGSKKKNFVEIYKQSQYKYILYAEGHCAACRYGFMMSLGSVILKVESQCVADQMWYFPLLEPFVDHVPVKADLSDLATQLEWCHNHDAECRQIAQNARRLYAKYVSREGVLDYLQCLCYEVSRRYLQVSPSYGTLEKAPNFVPFPVERLNEAMAQSSRKRNHHGAMEDHQSDGGCLKNGGYCTYCEAKRRKIEEKENAARSSKALSSLDTLAQHVQAAQEMNLRKSKRELFVQRAMEKRAAASASGADTTK